MNIKIFFILFFFILQKNSIFIRQIPDRKLKDFIGYRSSMIISPYKSEEKLRAPSIANYTPVKFKLIGGPSIVIRKMGGENLKKKKKIL